ncbi:rhomboid family intramembrane serine protease [Buchananella felis]|uniref:rhomboid family intramembrane serine protease n=1 Tax=Buchananella felis TaxID=3231492 RepID=UPI00352869EC
MSETTMPATPRCRAHGRPSWVLCQRCGNAVCPDCQVRAAVGVHCTSCAKAGRPSSAVAAKLSRVQGPLVSYVLIAACVLVFLAEQINPKLFYTLAFSPAAGEGEFYRFLTTTFLHGGLAHLAFNMYALYLLGRTLETALGRAQFLSLYLLGALGGSVAVLWLSDPTSAAWVSGTVGASGAIFALFGAIFAIQRSLNADTTQILIVLGINALISFTLPNISWQGHLGGLVVGVAAGYLLMSARAADRKRGAAAFRAGKRGAALWGARNARTLASLAVLGALEVGAVVLRYALVA